LITISGNKTFIKPFVFTSNIHTIHNVPAGQNEKTIQNIFHIPAGKSHVAIFGKPPIVGVFAIQAGDAVVVDNGNMRNFAEQFSKLRKKWFGKIIIHSKTFRVPFVAPPAFVAINCDAEIGRVKRNHIFAARIAFAGIQSESVAPSVAALSATRRTKCRRRHADFFVKAKIIQLNHEIFFAVLADFIFVFVFHLFHLCQTPSV
jgi:hypothetical protein